MTTMSTSIKNNRIDLRVDDLSKETLEKAAFLKDLSLTSYITSVCLKQARQDIADSETVTVSSAQSGLILELLDDAPEPNKRLKDLLNGNNSDR